VGTATRRAASATYDAVTKVFCRASTSPGTNTISGTGPDTVSPVTLAPQRFENFQSVIVNMERGVRSAKLEYRQILSEFNDLVFKLAGVTPGGPGVSLDRLDWATREATRIFGYNPQMYLLAGD
jgi:hypothetical protein